MQLESICVRGNCDSVPRIRIVASGVLGWRFDVTRRRVLSHERWGGLRVIDIGNGSIRWAVCAMTSLITTQDPVFSIANFEFESAAWNWSPEGQKEKQEQNESLLARNQGTGISATR